MKLASIPTVFIYLPCLLLSTPANAYIDGELSHATTHGGPVFDCPAGDVPAFPAGTLTVVLLDNLGQPVARIPGIYLEGDPGATPDPHRPGEA